MIRLLIIGLAVYLLYRALRSWLSPSLKSGREDSGGTIDQMVQDPSCQTYIPLREAKKRVIDGQTYYFCSKECYEKFEKEIKTGGRE